MIEVKKQRTLVKQDDDGDIEQKKRHTKKANSIRVFLEVLLTINVRAEDEKEKANECLDVENMH